MATVESMAIMGAAPMPAEMRTRGTLLLAAEEEWAEDLRLPGESSRVVRKNSPVGWETSMVSPTSRWSIRALETRPGSEYETETALAKRVPISRLTLMR